MPMDEPNSAPEVIPLPDFIRKLSEGLRANAALDQDMVTILNTHLIEAEINDRSVEAAASAIEKLATDRSEKKHG